MQFNTYQFVLLFLPLTVAGYFLLNRLSFRAGQFFLLAANLVFYAQAGAKCAAILALSLAVNYGLSLALRRKSGRARKAVLVLGILFNAGLLFYFKYYNFFLTNVNLVFHTQLALKDLLLPLGISFFTFQQISWLLDCAKEENRDYTLLEYALYILFFPKLIMGPLTEPEDFIPQLRSTENKSLNADNLMLGVRMFTLGLFKKVVLADTFARAANWGFANGDSLFTLDVVLVMLAYTFQIYFDFSGYSDMAIAVAKMLNLDLPINFDAPYRALSIGGFWKGWHVSLTSFFTRHLYIPLGGSRCGAFRAYRNVMIVFLVSGIWHGANWTFILWGLLHGAALVVYKMIHTRYDKLPKVLRWALTFALVNVLWLLFRAESVSQWLHMLGQLFPFTGLSVSYGLLAALVKPEYDLLSHLLPLKQLLASPVLVLAIGAVVGVLGLWLIWSLCGSTHRRKFPNTWRAIVLQVVMLVWCLISLSGEATFVYFGF